MKKLLSILLLSLASFVASGASPRDHTFDVCQERMTSGMCQVAADVKAYPIGGKTLLSGIGRVSNESYLKIRNTRNDLEADGKTFTMCAMIKVVCNPDMTEVIKGTDDCKVVYGSWGRDA